MEQYAEMTHRAPPPRGTGRGLPLSGSPRHYSRLGIPSTDRGRRDTERERRHTPSAAIAAVPAAGIPGACVASVPPSFVCCRRFLRLVRVPVPVFGLVFVACLRWCRAPLGRSAPLCACARCPGAAVPGVSAPAVCAGALPAAVPPAFCLSR